MPIRFRCAYCNQLMGIARRKAGTVVRCPKCAGEIIVPVPEGMEEPEDTAQPGGAPAFDVEPVFPDMGLSTPGAVPIPAEPAASVAPASSPAPAAATAPVPMPAPQRVGVFMPLGMLIISIGVIVLLLILLFVVGILIGRATMIPEAKGAALLGNMLRYVC